MSEALYRKYRPQTFADVVGQDHIERTIRNAIEQDKVSHAYLFCGPRGTGKTTTARLLAKALLCEHGPTPDPDGTCQDCTEIASGTHPDVYELDAASRTGVENVREEIIGRVQFAPTRGRKKVYIIDEVHMLSTAAFNALLKTLEEPPDHVVFILCTTDPQKVPETIHSRCQRFDFRRIGSESIVSRLGAICMAENVEFEGEALELIAHRAEGGMRNALTALEQVIAFGEGKVTLKATEDMLGSLDVEDMAEIVDAIGVRDVAACFRWTARYIETGADLAQFARDLAEHFRNMYVLSMAGADVALDVSEVERRELVREMANYGPDRLANLMGVLGDVLAELRTSTNPRLTFEIGLTRMVRPDSDLTLASLAERVEALEAGKSAVAYGATERTAPANTKTSGQGVLESTAPTALEAVASPVPDAGAMQDESGAVNEPALRPAVAPASASAPADGSSTARMQPSSAPHPASPTPAAVVHADAPKPEAVLSSGTPTPVAALPTEGAAVPSSARKEAVPPRVPSVQTPASQSGSDVLSASPTAPEASLKAGSGTGQPSSPQAGGTAAVSPVSAAGQGGASAGDHRRFGETAPELAAKLQNPAALQRIWQAAVSAVRRKNPMLGTVYLNTEVTCEGAGEGIQVAFPHRNKFGFIAASKPDAVETMLGLLRQAAGASVALRLTVQEEEREVPSAAVGEAVPHASQQDFGGSALSQAAAPAAFSGVQAETPPAAAGAPTVVPRPITPPHTTGDSAPGASRSEPPSAEGAATVQGGQRQVPGGVPAPTIPRLRRSHSSVDGTRAVGVAPDEEPVLPSDAAVDVPEADMPRLAPKRKKPLPIPTKDALLPTYVKEGVRPAEADERAGEMPVSAEPADQADCSAAGQEAAGAPVAAASSPDGFASASSGVADAPVASVVPDEEDYDRVPLDAYEGMGLPDEEEAVVLPWEDEPTGGSASSVPSDAAACPETSSPSQAAGVAPMAGPPSVPTSLSAQPRPSVPSDDTSQDTAAAPAAAPAASCGSEPTPDELNAFLVSGFGEGVVFQEVKE